MGSNRGINPESPCSVCGSYGHFTHNHSPGSKPTTPWLQDPDVTLYHGDVLSVLREFPAESVDCCVTSPPYWGLRDYGTGAWEGGDEGCDHDQRRRERDPDSKSATNAGSSRDGVAGREACRKCGATRIDQQLGLEPTPEQYVTRMVEVFREVRRVLAAHGTVWLNLGDSYASSPAGNTKPRDEGGDGAGRFDYSATPARMAHQEESRKRQDKSRIPGLKPKDLVGIPWRVAFALQADGWYLRSDIIWAKPNPMPESVTDRPTKSHEYLFLLSKQPRYFFDQEAVREAQQEGPMRWGSNGKYEGQALKAAALEGAERNPAGRNIRSVWSIATQPYPEAHFATFPEELARRCIAAGCPEQVCRVCGKARERVVELGEPRRLGHGQAAHRETAKWSEVQQGGVATSGLVTNRTRDKTTIGLTDCGHSDYRAGVTLDPFIGSGTVAHVARKLGRHAVGIDLNSSYLELAARRLQQQSLFAQESA